MVYRITGTSKQLNCMWWKYEVDINVERTTRIFVFNEPFQTGHVAVLQETRQMIVFYPKANL